MTQVGRIEEVLMEIRFLTANSSHLNHIKKVKFDLLDEITDLLIDYMDQLNGYRLKDKGDET